MTSTLVPFVALGIALGAGQAQGQAMSFLRQISAQSLERATAVAANASGIYVVGDGRSGQAGLRKFDALGNELWTREFSAPPRIAFLSVAVATDAVYAIGFAGSEPQTSIFKYSADGTHRWTRPLGFAGAATLAADAGGVYVTGWDSRPDGTYLRKYGTDGVELWTSRLGSAPTLDFPRGIAVDATGVYVLLMTGASSEVVIRKFDAGGRSLWTRPNEMLIGSPGTGIATDATGIYVLSGYRTGGYSLSKVDPAGNELWLRHVDKLHPFFSGRYLRSLYPSGVTADATGVYFAGWKSFPRALPGQCSSSSGGDSFVSRYDRDGAEVWTREFGTPDAAWASGIAVDADGVYVAGQEGTAMFLDDVEWSGLSGPLAPASVSRGAFLARFEKAGPVATGLGPRIFPGCVVNAASYVGGGVAAGEIVTLFGSAVGPAEIVGLRTTEQGKLATLLAGTRILFNGMAAPLVYVSANQSSAIVPLAVAGQSAVDVQVEYQGIRSEAVTVPVLTSRPGIFSQDGSGEGQGAILNQDGSLNSPSNPARRGSIVTLYATGGGEAAAGIEDGQILSNILPRTSLPVAVFFDLGNNEFPVPSKPGEVLYAGGVSGSVAGLLQVDVRVPANAVATGRAVPFVLVIGSHWTVYQVGIALR